MKIDPYSSTIDTRWRNRIVANGWDKEGKRGAQKYLDAYGKNIGVDKLEALRDRAKAERATDMADGFQDAINRLTGKPVISKTSTSSPAAPVDQSHLLKFQRLWTELLGPNFPSYDYLQADLKKEGTRVFMTTQPKIKKMANEFTINSKVQIPTLDPDIFLTSKDFEWVEKYNNWYFKYQGNYYIIEPK